QALQMVWDFCEANPFSKFSGGFANALEWVTNVIDQTAAGVRTSGQTLQGDATKLSLPDFSAEVIFTDPPYYDSVPYADLSDFFYVWLRRTDPNGLLARDPFDTQNVLTPKIQEAVWNQSYVVEGKRKSPKFFEERIKMAFAEVSRVLSETGIACIVF